jgi:hypothetical protein
LFTGVRRWFGSLHSQDAARALRAALEIDPAFLEARFMLGVCLHGLGHHHAAVAEYTVSFLGDATSILGDATRSLGDSESSLGDSESSLGDAESSLGDAESSLGDAKSSLGDAGS